MSAAREQTETILAVGVADAAALARLHAELFEPAWDTGSFKQILTHPGCAALFARSSRTGKIVGFVIGRSAADEMEILSLGVARERQRQGIGRRLLEALIGVASRSEVRRLYLEAAAGNSAAIALYSRLGFEQCGRRRGYYARAGAPAEDAILLSLVLSPDARP